MPLAVICRRCGKLSPTALCAECAEGEAAHRYATEDSYRKRGRGGYYQSPTWRALSKACIERDGRACVLCGRGAPEVRLVAHHLIPRSQGGPDKLSNLVALCVAHNTQVDADLRAGVESAEVRTLAALIPDRSPNSGY